MEKLFRFSSRSLLDSRDDSACADVRVGQEREQDDDFSEPVFSLLQLTFSKCLLGDAEEVFLLSSARKGSWSARMWNCWQLFHRKPILRSLPLRLPLKTYFEKSEMSLEMFALFLFQSHCQSLALGAQMHRETSPSPESMLPFPLDHRAPQNVQRSCLLTCWLLTGKEDYPQPSLKLSLRTVLKGWICQRAVRADIGPASAGSLWWCDLSSCTGPGVLSYCLNQWPRPQAPGNR